MERPQITTVTLDPITFRAQKYIQAHLSDFPNTVLEARIDAQIHALVLDLKTTVLGHNFDPVYIKHPMNWKEAFKERWFPDWALTRWPVRYTTHVVSWAGTYPDFKVALPKHQSKFVLHQQVSSWTE